MAKYWIALIPLGVVAFGLVLVSHDRFTDPLSSLENAEHSSNAEIKSSVLGTIDVDNTVLAADAGDQRADSGVPSESTASELLKPEMAKPKDTHELPALPGEEINYAFKVGRLDYYDLDGRVDSDIGGLNFKAHLTPTSEVILDIELDRPLEKLADTSSDSSLSSSDAHAASEEQSLLIAHIDIARFTMSLDGGGTVLTEEQKQVMEYTVAHLTKTLVDQYQDEIPYHGLMAVQMMSYWSKSPEGYQHGKREIVSR